MYLFKSREIICGIIIGPRPVSVIAMPIARPRFSRKYVFTDREKDAIARPIPRAKKKLIVNKINYINISSFFVVDRKVF